MNSIHRTKKKILSFFGITALIFFLAGNARAQIQCAPTASGAPCVGNLITFNANSPTANSWRWDFGGLGTSIQQNPGFTFGSPGTYMVTLVAKNTANPNDSCQKSFNVVVKPAPTVNVKLINQQTQCFLNNQFCFSDSSLSAVGGSIVRRTILFSDGFVQTEFKPALKFPNSFCHSIADPAGGNFDLTIELEDSNGCITKVIFPSIINVRASLQLSFTSNAPIGCGSTTATFTNNSGVPQSDIASFVWTFGDGNTVSGDSISGPWKPTLQHTYTTNGTFNALLTVTTKFNCTEVFTFNAAATNVVIAPKITADKDSTCFADPKITFSTTPIPGARKFWNFGDPNTGPMNVDTTTWTPEHIFSALGPFRISLRVIIGPCDTTVFDTIMILGPQATIENTPAGIFIADTERYQCNVRYPVHFTNLSKYFRNDTNYANDTLPGNWPAQPATSGGGFPNRYNNHTIRVWDFGDQYAPRCTTWTARGLNVGRNCRFSRDTLPVHMYTPWDTIYRDSFYRPNVPFRTTVLNEPGKRCDVIQVDTNNRPLHYKLFVDNVIQCYTVRLYLQDTIHPMMCGHTSTIQMAFGAPNARGLKFQGVRCFPPPPANYGVVFSMEDTKPGCTQYRTWVNFDSLSNPNQFSLNPNPPAGWIGHNGLMMGNPPMPSPWVPPGPPIFPPWPNTFTKIYNQSEIADKKTGWVTVGLTIQNGVGPDACFDTKWYHNMFKYLQLDARFTMWEPMDLTDPTLKTICVNESVLVAVDKQQQDSVTSATWNFNDGTSYTEMYFRYKPNPKNTATLRNFVTRNFTRDTIFFRNQQVKVGRFIPGSHKCLSVDTTITVRVDSTVQVTDTIVTNIIKRWDIVGDFTDAVSLLRAQFKSISVDMDDLTNKQITQYIDFKCIDTTGFGQLIKYGVNVLEIDTTKWHFKDSIVGSTDTINGIAGAIRHRYKTAGQYVVVLTLINTDGCRNIRGVPVNVGFFNRLTTTNDLTDTIICQGQVIDFVDNIRYFSWNDPFNPLDNFPYWRDFNRITAGRETMRWNFGDGTPIADGPTPQHTYANPGIFNVTLSMKDSMNCRDTIRQKIFVTGVKAGFTQQYKLLNCKSIMTFTDTSIVYDPCCGTGITCDSIIKWEWDFGDGTKKSLLPGTVGHDYTSFGTYKVKLKVETVLGCIDSVEHTIVLPGPQPFFVPIGPTVVCAGEPICFVNTSINPTPSAQWVWNFGDGFTETDTVKDTTCHVYNTPGFFNVFLTQFDSIPASNVYCSAMYPDTNAKVNPSGLLITVQVLPKAPVDITASDTVVCPNQVINFTSNSDPIYTTFTWIFGNNDTLVTTVPNVSYSFPNAGKYWVKLVPDYPGPDPKCKDVDSVLIDVLTVNADFTIDSTQKPKFCFTNTSSGAVSYRWDFKSAPDANPFSSFTTDVNPCKTYSLQELGEFYVCLIATNSLGCEDTICKTVFNDFFAEFDRYNVFTPGDDDGLNDVFKFKIVGQDMFDLKIYNRWGEVVFKTLDAKEGWNGKVNNTGAESPAGTYFYVLTYRLKGQTEQSINGTVTLIRK